MTNNKTAVSLCRAQAEAKLVVLELQRSGVDLNHLPILELSHQPNKQPLNRYHPGRRMKTWGTKGAFWSGILGS